MKVLCQNHTFSLCASTCVFFCCISSLISSVADVTVDLVQINRLHYATLLSVLPRSAFICISC